MSRPVDVRKLVEATARLVDLSDDVRQGAVDGGDTVALETLCRRLDILIEDLSEIVARDSAMDDRYSGRDSA